MQNQDISRLPAILEEGKASCKKYTIDIPSPIVSKIEILFNKYQQKNIDQFIVELVGLSLAQAEQPTETIHFRFAAPNPNAIESAGVLMGTNAARQNSSQMDQRLSIYPTNETTNEGELTIDDFSYGPVACARFSTGNLK
jgi:hypothetical protein